MEKATNESSVWEEKQPRKLHFDTSDVELTKLEIASGKCSQIIPSFEKNSRLVLLVALLGFTVALLGFVPSPELPKWSFDQKQLLDEISERGGVFIDFVKSQSLYGYENAKIVVMDRLSNVKMPNTGNILWSLVWPLFWGILFTSFSWYVVYLDSSIPGVNPPTPFSASKKSLYSQPERKLQLGYITATVSGVLVFLITYSSNNK